MFRVELGTSAHDVRYVILRPGLTYVLLIDWLELWDGRSDIEVDYNGITYIFKLTYDYACLRIPSETGVCKIERKLDRCDIYVYTKQGDLYCRSSEYSSCKILDLKKKTIVKMVNLIEVNSISRLSRGCKSDRSILQI